MKTIMRLTRLSIGDIGNSVSGMLSILANARKIKKKKH